MTENEMRLVRVTPKMAVRMLAWLERAGIVELLDTETIDDLMAATQPVAALPLPKETVQ